jgi:hypothetical protein
LVDAVRPVSEYVVVVEVPTCVPPRNTLYPVTPTLSVDAVHERLICEDDTAVAVNPVGTVGACVSVTVTVAVAVTVPTLFVAVSVYVVVAVGCTTTDEPETLPTPWLIDSVGAGFPETFHDRVDDPPVPIDAGLALKEEITGAEVPACVVADAGELCADTLPAASNAATVYVYVVLGASPMSVYVVPVDVAIWLPFRKIWYPVTPTLSVEAPHERLIAVAEIASALSPVGVVGGCVSLPPVTALKATACAR